MKKLKNLLSAAGGETNRQALKGGSYSLAMTAVVLAVLVAVNVLVSALPTPLTKYDISSSKLYSITSNTKVVVNALDRDVTIYWIAQSGEEDDVLSNLLAKYESLSDHLQVVKKNPDVYPTFAQQYTDETVKNNSLVVECGDKNRYIAFDDIYLGEMNMYTGTYSTTDFDGEGAITSAIDYVTSDEYPQVYVLEGHGEADLPDAFRDQIEKENMEINSLSLLTVDEIPEDAACIVIYGPASDISPEEKEMLSDYASDGGKLLVMSGPVKEGTLDNLNALLGDYGLVVCDGIVVDSDREHYAFGMPYVLMPELQSDAITDSLMAENYFPILPISQGLTLEEDTVRGSIAPLLVTSDDSYSKIAGYDLTTYEREEGDIDGPFALAVSIADNSGGQIVWFTSDAFLQETYNAYSSGANMDLAMNALSSLVGETEAMAIRTKSLNYNYLTISDSTSSLLKVLMIGVFPLAYLGVGIIVVIKRKKVQHETV